VKWSNFRGGILRHLANHRRNTDSMHVSVPTRMRSSYEGGADMGQRSMGHPCSWKVKEPAGIRDGLAENRSPALESSLAGGVSQGLHDDSHQASHEKRNDTPPG
jgi:hypothetical protein